MLILINHIEHFVHSQLSQDLCVAEPDHQHQKGVTGGKIN
jgi:hypothetical protein